MNKAFTREDSEAVEDDDLQDASPLPAGSRNYMTPGGFARLRGFTRAGAAEKDDAEHADETRARQRRRQRQQSAHAWHEDFQRPLWQIGADQDRLQG